MKKFISQYALYIAWVQALIAMVGSLYFSEIAHFTPCLLCWYQRIAMYPLVLILAIGIARRDKLVHIYALPLAVIGALVGVYHNLMYYGFIPEKYAPCTIGASCTTKYIDWLGFITIPLLSLSAFIIIIACLVIHAKNLSGKTQTETEE